MTSPRAPPAFHYPFDAPPIDASNPVEDALMSKNRDAIAKEAEARIMKVSEMIAENIMATLIDLPWSGMETYTHDLNDMLAVLDPYAAKGIKTHCSVYEEKAGAAKYTIGIIAGFHRAGRTDLIPQFARAYAAEADIPMEDEASEEPIPATH